MHWKTQVTKEGWAEMLPIYLAMLDGDDEKSKFESLYLTYRKLMFHVANGILNDEGLAEDAVHRYVRLFIVLFVPHAAAVAVMFGKVNASISEYLAAFPEYAPFPAVNILIPLTHCAVALNFYMAMTLFLMLLFRDAVIPVVLIMAWCALEAGPLNIIFQRYDMFAGAFGPQDFYSYLPPNILWMLIAQPILLCLVFVFYGKRSFLGAPVQSFRRVFRKRSGLGCARFDKERWNDYEN